MYRYPRLSQCLAIASLVFMMLGIWPTHGQGQDISFETTNSELEQIRLSQEAQWSKDIPYNDLLEERCGAPYYTLKRDRLGEDYQCLKQVSSELLRDRLAILRETISAFNSGNCEAFFQLLEQDIKPVERQMTYIEIFLLDKGICREKDSQLALTLWENFAKEQTYDWYTSSRLSDAYWRGEVVPKNEDKAWAFAYRALVEAYADGHGPYVDDLSWLLARDSDVNPAEVLWGLLDGGLAQNFSWWLEGPWPMPEPLIEIRNKLHTMLEDDSEETAAEVAKQLWDEGILLKEAYFLLSTATANSGRGDLYFLKYKWRLEDKAVDGWRGDVFEQDKDDNGRWDSQNLACHTLSNLHEAADRGHQAAIAEIAHFLAQFDVPLNTEDYLVSGLLNRLAKDTEDEGLTLHPRAAKLLSEFRSSADYNQNPILVSDYYRLSDIFCS